MARRDLLILAVLLVFGTVSHAAPSGTVKSDVLKRVREDREIYTSARLEEARDPRRPKHRPYRFLTVMQVSAPIERVRAVLTDYPLYERLIPYVSRSAFDPKSGILALEGGVLGYQLESRVRFAHPSPDRVAYEVVGGHFTGLKGMMSFERSGERGSLVSLEGAHESEHFPPKLILEEGARIVFTLAGKKMRSWIEEESRRAGPQSAEPGVPQPKR